MLARPHPPGVTVFKSGEARLAPTS